MQNNAAPETKTDIVEAPKQPTLMVQQPQKLESLLSDLNMIDSFSEKISEDRSGSWSGPSGTGTTQGDDVGTTAVSPRDQALANLPQPTIMQKTIKKHVEKEIKTLHKEMKRISRMSRPGAAYKLNQMYARIRRLRSFLSELLEASYDVLKRVFIRIVIDKQSPL